MGKKSIEKKKTRIDHNGGAFISVSTRKFMPDFTLHLLVPSLEKRKSKRRPKFWGPFKKEILRMHSVLREKYKTDKSHLVPYSHMKRHSDRIKVQNLSNNIIPLKSTVNQGNVKIVEENIREHAKKQRLAIYTGHLGVIQDQKELTSRLNVPMYMYWIILNLDILNACTEEILECIVTCNDAGSEAENLLPDGDIKSKYLKAVEEKSEMGITRAMKLDDFWELCNKWFPSANTPREYISKTTDILKKIRLNNPSFVDTLPK